MTRKPLSALFFLTVLLPFCEMWSRHSNTTAEYVAQNWRQTYVQHCGLVCENGTRVRLYADDDCEQPACFQCNCHPTCSKLDTCCPEGVVHPNGSVTLAEKEPEEPSMMPPYPEQMQCGAVPFVLSHYVQVASCPSLTKDQVLGLSANILERVSLETKHLCEKEIEENSTLEFMQPFVDVHTGLVFKNKFCALCNGYDLNTASVASNSTSIISPYKNRIASPWVVSVNCSHYQLMYTLKSRKELVEKAALVRYGCLVFYTLSYTERQPTSCYSKVRREYDNLNCYEPFKDLCHNLNSTKYMVQGHKNLFCFLCVEKETFRINSVDCYSEPNRIYFRYPPITLLLGVSTPKTPDDVLRRKNCASSVQWLDGRVSKLSVV
ncbi:hypothetical protein ElyMa_004161200 [Elysia marginata]|uniref:SMB domain-containing protein n=1 Tax=Elysia marginata TaxID=1093978 RepID=A0AAV4GHG5_9GAST|nr:hypothetical protein ElyMa_004161200 [Elysia marginata]